MGVVSEWGGPSGDCCICSCGRIRNGGRRTAEFGEKVHKFLLEDIEVRKTCCASQVGDTGAKVG